MKSSLLKSFFNKKIKQRLINKSWVQKSHLIYIKSESELLKGIYFNSSAFSPSQFEAVAFIQPLYVPSSTIFLSFGKTLRTKNSGQWWNYSEALSEQQGIDLAEQINEIEKSFFNNIMNAESFYEYYKKNKKTTVGYFEAVAYSACFAKLKESEKEILELLKYIKAKEDLTINWVKELYDRTENINNLIISNDEPYKLLEKWLLETKASIKI